MSRILGRFRKQPAEKLQYRVVYTPWLSAGETLSSVSTSIDTVTTPPLAISSVAIVDASTTVTFFVEGGLDLTEYKVTLVATTSLGQIVEREMYFSVEEVLMARLLFTNNAIGFLDVGVSSGATTFTLGFNEGALFPSPGVDEYAKVTLEDRRLGFVEIVHLTTRTGDTLTVLRGQEGTTARAWDEGTQVSNRLTAGALSDIQQRTDEAFEAAADTAITTAENVFTQENTFPKLNIVAVDSVTDSSIRMAGSPVLRGVSGGFYMVTRAVAGFFQFLTGVSADGVAGGTVAAQIDAAGTAMPNTYTVATREKGDARWVKSSPTADIVTLIKQELVNALYPVGALYISTLSANPGAGGALGFGTWVAHAAGRALVGVGNNGVFDWTDGIQRGSEEVTLTIGQIPAHEHALIRGGSGSIDLEAGNNIVRTWAGGGDVLNYQLKGATTGTWLGLSQSKGNDQGHSNIQPSVAVFVWRRTA